jgi:hypothetical protein
VAAYAGDSRSLLQRAPHHFRDHGWRLVQCKRDRPLEPVRARDEYADLALRVGRDPRFMRCAHAPAAGLDGCFDALAAGGGDALGVEDGEQHRA